ncbi:SRPBCC family protein [Pseudofulvibacter geojedonensis]|uniref:SRPBCC family protein n=1 Tax=Pseudofulvibacter geojedonensis TaxID=1123758 RepID=A0ABW3I504_9FLAO
MNIEGNKIIVNQAKGDVISFLTSVENFEKLMPEGAKFEVLGDDIFLFALKGMPEIKLRLQEQTEDKVILGAASDKLPFTLTADLKEIETTKTEAQLSFEGQFNPMMAMMVKGPITKFVGQLSEKLALI